MFEGWAADLVARYLGEYVKGVDLDQVQLDVRNGLIQLSNLRLRRKRVSSMLSAEMGFPVTLRYGSIDSVRLKVPWRNLGAKESEVEVDGILVVCGPQDANEAEAERAERAFQDKLLRLEKREAVWASSSNGASATDGSAAHPSTERGPTNGESEREQSTSGMKLDGTTSDSTPVKGWFAALMTKMVDNVQFFVTNVHIRYEDDRLDPQRPFALGATLQSMTVRSSDESWFPKFVKEAHDIIHKLVEVKNVALYWNSDEPLLPAGAPERLAEMLRNMIYSDEIPQRGLSYIVNPISGALKLRINKKPSAEVPMYEMNFEFKSIEASLDRQQYHQTVALADRLSAQSADDAGLANSARCGAVRWNRQRPFVRPSRQSAKDWWKWTIACVVDNVRARRREKTAEYISERRSMRLMYMNLYKRKLKGQSLAPIDVARLDELERTLLFDDIAYFRDLAHVQVHRERAHVKQQRAQLAVERQSQGWASWVVSGVAGYAGYGGVVAEDIPGLSQLSQEELREFYATIDYEPGSGEKVQQHTLPVQPSSPRIVIQLRIDNGNVTLRQRPGFDIVELELGAIKANLLLRDTSTFVSLILDSVDVFDRCTPRTRFARLVAPVQQDSRQTEQELEPDDVADVKPFFNFSFETNPLDSDYAYRLILDMLPLEIVYNYAFAQQTVDFFSMASDGEDGSNVVGMQWLSKLEHAAALQFEALALKTVRQLEIDEYAAIDLRINVSAPKLLVPEFLDRPETTLVVIDLGHLSIESERALSLPSGGTLDDFDIVEPRDSANPSFKFGSDHDGASEPTADISVSHLNPHDSSYDRFRVRLSTVQLLLMSIDTSGNVDSVQIVDKFDINVSFYYCKITSDFGRTRLKIFADAVGVPGAANESDTPSLRFNASHDSALILIRIAAGVLREMNSDTTSAKVTSPDNVLSSASESIWESSINMSSLFRGTMGLPNVDYANGGMSGVVAQTKMLEVNCSLPQVSFVISTSADRAPSAEVARTETELIRVVLSGVAARLLVRPYDQKVVLSMRDLVIIDRLQRAGEDFQYLATSEKRQEVADDMIRCSLLITDRSSPFFVGVDQRAAVHFSTLHMVWNQETLLVLVELAQSLAIAFNKAFSESDSMPRKQDSNFKRSHRSTLIRSASTAFDQVALPRPTVVDSISTISAQLKSVEVKLASHGVLVARCMLSDCDVSARMLADGSASVCGTLGELCVQDLSYRQGAVETANLYEDVVGIVGQNFVTFALERTRSAHSCVPEASFISRIHLQVHAMRIVLLRAFIARLSSYFAALDEPVDALLANAAGEVDDANLTISCDAISELLLFRIEVTNPVLVIPRHRGSRARIVCNLGDILISNDFLRGTSQGDTVESIFVTAHRIGAFTMPDTVSELEIPQRIEDTFVREFELRADIRRNVYGTQSWSVNADSTAFFVDTHDEQFDLLVGILRENVAEQSGTSSGKEAVDRSRLHTVRTESSDSVAVLASLRVPEFKMTLTTAVSLGQTFPLLIFSSQQVEFSARLHSSNALVFDVVVMDLSLRDGRLPVGAPAKTDGVVGFFWGTPPDGWMGSNDSSNESDEKSAMVGRKPRLELNYGYSPGGAIEHSVLISMSSSKSVLVIDVLVDLYKAFYPKIQVLNADSSPSLSRPTRGPSLELRLAAEQLEFWIPVPRTQLAFIGFGTFAVKLLAKDDYQDVKIFMQQFRVTKGRAASRFDSAATVVKSVDVVAGFTQSTTSTQVIDVIVEPLHAIISFRDILDAHSLMQNAVDATSMLRTESMLGHTVADETSPATVLTTLKIARLQATLVDDLQYNMQALPFCDACVSDLDMAFEGRELFAVGYVEVLYYNHTLAMWEPWVEKWAVQTEVDLGSASDDVLVRKASVRIKSTQTLNVNITKALFVAVEKSTSSWLKGRSPDPLSGSRHHQRNVLRAPFLLRNETGQQLHCRLSGPVPSTRTLLSSSALGQGASPVLGDANDTKDFEMSIEPDAECPLPLTAPASRESVPHSRRTLTIKLALWSEIKHLPMSRVGTYLVPLIPSPMDCNPKLVYEVTFREGCKVIVVRSNARVRNTCRMPIMIAFREPNKSTLRDWTVIEPGASKAIPVSDTRRITHYRPAFADGSITHGWSVAELHFSSRRSNDQVVKCLPSAGVAAPVLFFVEAVSGDRDQQTEAPSDQYTVSLRPPLILENVLSEDMEFRVIDADSGITLAARVIKCGEEDWIHEVDVDSPRPCTLSVKVSRFGWSNSVPLVLNDTAMFTLLAKGTSSASRTLNIQAAIMRQQGSLHVSMHCRYWIINRTGLPLLYSPSTSLAPIRSYEATGTLSSNPRIVEGEVTPQMFSYESSVYNLGNVFESRTCVAFPGTRWSRGISLESAGVDLCVDVIEKHTPGRPPRLWQLGIDIELGSKQFKRTKFVTFVPRFVLINRMADRHTLLYKQAGSTSQSASSTNFTELAYGGKAPLFWADASLTQALRIRLADDAGSEWSDSISLDQLGDFAVKIPLARLNTAAHAASQEVNYYIVGVQVQLRHGTFFVVFKGQDPKYPPYRIENFTTEIVKIHQKVAGKIQRLEPYNSIPYTWDDPAKYHKLVIAFPHVSADFRKEFSLDIIKNYDPITLYGDALDHAPADRDSTLQSLTITAKTPLKKLKFRVIVFADGPTRVMRILDASVYLEGITTSEAQTGQLRASRFWTDITGDEVLTRPLVPADSRDIEVAIELAGVGVSVVDERPQEVVYASMHGISLNYSNSSLNQMLEFSIGDLQVDNQLPSARFPVVLARARTPRVGVEAVSASSGKIFHVSIVKSNQYDAIDFFNYFSVLLQEIDLRLEDECLWRLRSFSTVPLPFARNNVPSRDRISAGTADANANSSELRQPLVVPGSAFDNVVDEKKVYFELLQVHPLRLNLSYSSSGSGVEQDDRFSDPVSGRTGIIGGSSTNETFFGTLLRAVTETVANLDGAQLTLNAMILEHVFSRRSQLTHRVSEHYEKRLASEVYKIVGAFDFLGNPVSLISGLGTGVKDFFYEPAQGLVKSPQDFGKGLARGTTSLVGNSVASIFNTASLISGSLGRGLARLTFDPAYVAQRAQQQQHRAQAMAASQVADASLARSMSGLSQGLVWGVRDLSVGLYSGFTGVFSQPWLGLTRDLSGRPTLSMSGLFVGLARGALGAAIKPAVGLMDLTARATHAISIQTSSMLFGLADRDATRGPIHRVRPPRCIGTDHVLERYSAVRAYGRALLDRIKPHQWYVFHAIFGNSILLVSHRQVWYLHRTTLQRRWTFPLRLVTQVEKNGDSVVFHLAVPRTTTRPQPDTRRISSPQTALLELAVAAVGDAVRNERMGWAVQLPQITDRL